jgi:hypothetical protein
MGLLDWFRRRGAPGAGAAEATDAHPATTSAPETEPDARTEAAHGAGVPAGSPAEGPPVGVSDPGSLTGEDDVVAAREGDEPDESGFDRPA